MTTKTCMVCGEETPWHGVAEHYRERHPEIAFEPFTLKYADKGKRSRSLYRCLVCGECKGAVQSIRQDDDLLSHWRDKHQDKQQKPITYVQKLKALEPSATTFAYQVLEEYTKLKQRVFELEGSAKTLRIERDLLQHQVEAKDREDKESFQAKLQRCLAVSGD